MLRVFNDLYTSGLESIWLTAYEISAAGKLVAIWRLYIMLAAMQ